MTNDESAVSLSRYAWLSVAAAVVTILLKTVAYFVTGSVGLLSDAAESVVNLVAAVVAVKGLGRWAELQTDPALTERFIIGTLASYIVAAGCGYAGLWALGDF